MMRWIPTDSTDVRDDAGFSGGDAVPATTDRVAGDSTLRYLLDAVAAAVAGLGARSAVVLMVMALVVATVLFGLSANEASALARWCPAC